jgi:hypothetical protein
MNIYVSKKVKIIFNLIFYLVSTAIIFLLATKFNFDNSSAFETITTFLSIIAGFSITAYSIFATANNLTSSVKRTVYYDKFKKFTLTYRKSRTLFDILIRGFKRLILVSVGTVGFILLYKFLPVTINTKFEVFTYRVSMHDLLKAIIWYLTSLSFFYFFQLLNVLSDIVIKNG